MKTMLATSTAGRNTSFGLMALVVLSGCCQLLGDCPPALSGECAVPTPSAQAVDEPYDGPDGYRLAVDLSGSMMGFLRAGSLRIVQLHEELYGALGDSVAGQGQVCLVGGKVSCLASPPAAAWFGQSSRYTLGESRFNIPLDLHSDFSPADQSLTVVTTDGVFSGASTGTAEDDGCAAGATVACVANRLNDLAHAGYGVWLLPITLDFDGIVYAERAMDSDMFKRVEQNIPEGASVSNFRASTDARYTYKGQRPILIWAVSRDIATGRAFIRKLSERLAAVEIGQKQEFPMRPYELAPLVRPSVDIEPLRVLSHGTRGFSIGAHQRFPGGLQHTIRCGSDDKAMLTTTVQPSVPGLAVQAPASVPEGAVFRAEAQGNQLRTGIVCEPFAKATRTPINLAITQSGDELPALDAIQRFHSRDSFSMPHRIFGVADISERVLRASVQRNKHLATLQICLERT